MEDRGLEMVVRSSIHYLTTDEEIDRLANAIARSRLDREPDPGC